MPTLRGCLLVALGFVSLGQAQETSWTGKTVLLKKLGTECFKDKDSVERLPIDLTMADYKVLLEAAGRVQLRQLDVNIWVDKGDLVLLGDAISYATERIMKNKRDAFAFGMRGWALKLNGRLDDAVKDYDEAIKLNAKEATFWSNRGTILAAMKNYDKAIKDYDEAIRLHPNYAIAFNNRGNALTNKRQFDKAIRDFDEAIRLQPRDAHAFSNRGNARAEKGDFDSAIKDYDEAIRLDPGYISPYHNESVLLLYCPDPKIRNPQKGLERARKVCELSAWRRADAVEALADAFAVNGDFDQAIKYLTKALEDKALKDQISPDARERLELYKQKKRP
jgi:tetratricopeptide (TPR) repeat protein